MKRFKAPAWLPGIDFSDHLNYWKFGYPAVLLTDTAFYRNRSYHEATDTLARLDMRRLGLAVDALAGHGVGAAAEYAANALAIYLLN